MQTSISGLICNNAANSFAFIRFTLKIKTRSFWVHDNFYVPLSIETAVVGFAYWLLVGSNFLPHVPRYYLAQLHPNNFLLWFYSLFKFLTILSVTPALSASCVCAICADLLIGLLHHSSINLKITFLWSERYLGGPCGCSQRLQSILLLLLSCLVGSFDDKFFSHKLSIFSISSFNMSTTSINSLTSSHSSIKDFLSSSEPLTKV